MSCLDNIVTLGLCEGEENLSGFTLMNAAGMSPVNGERIASEQYGNGITLFNAKKQIAINTVRNDFLGVLQANNIATTIADKLYDTSSFDTSKDMGNYTGFRGVKVHGVHAGVRGGLRKLKIKAIQCYPLVSMGGEIKILDFESGVEITTTIPVTFVANQLNTFTLPIPYIAKNPQIAVVIDNSVQHFASSIITCKRGCNGTANNPCAWSNGWDGTQEVRHEGYGINVQFFCTCDYDSLMCDLSKPYLGELIWLKWQEYVFDEQRKTNRFNAWVTYNRDDLVTYIHEIQGQYSAKFNSMLSGGLFNILKNYRDECLQCRGLRVSTNI